MANPRSAAPLSAELLQRIAAHLGAEVAASRPTAGGYTPAQRHIVTLRDGRTLFVKAARRSFVAGWLRREQAVYAALEGAPFAPRMLGWLDHPAHPALLLEDRSADRWPPPWQGGDVEAVCDALAAVHRHPLSLDLPDIIAEEGLGQGWEAVARAPTAFLGLGRVSAAWLRESLPRLREAAAGAPLRGGRAAAPRCAQRQPLPGRGGRAGRG